MAKLSAVIWCFSLAFALTSRTKMKAHEDNNKKNNNNAPEAVSGLQINVRCWDFVQGFGYRVEDHKVDVGKDFHWYMDLDLRPFSAISTGLNDMVVNACRETIHSITEERHDVRIAVSGADPYEKKYRNPPKEMTPLASVTRSVWKQLGESGQAKWADDAWWKSANEASNLTQGSVHVEAYLLWKARHDLAKK